MKTNFKYHRLLLSMCLTIFASLEAVAQFETQKTSNTAHEILLNKEKSETKGQKVEIPDVKEIAKKLLITKEEVRKLEADGMLKKFRWANSQKVNGGVDTGGGDEDGIDFRASAALGLQQILPLLNSSQSSITRLVYQRARVLVLEESQYAKLTVNLNGVEQDSAAINDIKTGMIYVHRSRWNLMTSNFKQRLAAHEYLSLARIEGTGFYPYSGQLFSTDFISYGACTQTIDKEQTEMRSSPYWRKQMNTLIQLLSGKQRRGCPPMSNDLESKLEIFADDVEFVLDASAGGSLKMWKAGHIPVEQMSPPTYSISFSVQAVESRSSSFDGSEGQVSISLFAGDLVAFSAFRARLGTNAQCSPKVFLANLIANVPSVLNMQCGHNRDQVNSSAQILENLRVEKAILDGAN